MGGVPAVIVDMDGTLCDVTSIRHLVMAHPKDFAAFHAGSRRCPPTPEVLTELFDHHSAGRVIVVVTARMYRWEHVTKEWLGEHLLLPHVGPFMRGDDDYRPDYDVKRDIHRILTDDHGLDIVHAIDDNPAIIRLWEELGISTTVVPGWPENADVTVPG